MEFALAIGGSLASSALPVLLEQAKAKMKKPLPVKEDITDLARQLGFISAAIKDHYKPDGKSVNHVREQWIKELRLLAYEIEDCTEKFLYRIMSEGEETDDTSKEFANDIARLKQTSNDIHQNLVKYDPKGDGPAPSAAWPPARVQERAPSSFAQTWCDPPEGMGKPMDDLQKLVREAGSELDRNLKVISIVGFGGLGKTLLAKEVYAAEKNEFALHAWVRADGKGPLQLLGDILDQLKGTATTSNDVVLQAEEVNGRSNSANASKIAKWLRLNKVSVVPKKDAEHAASIIDVATIHDQGKGMATDDDVCDVTTTKLDQIKQRLRSCIQHRRYLIVIIDMRETSQWPGIEAFPRKSGIDSRIIVTTTKHPVAKCCSDSGGRVYEMSTLSDEDSRKVLFRTRNEPSSPVRPETSQIIEKCGGLPLALLSTRDILMGKTINVGKIEQAFREICGPEIQKEVKAAENEGQDGRAPQERMRQVLLSTYEGLPNHFVQVCLLYFSMYPGHHVVKTDSLIRKWLAEGLVQTGDGDAVENLDALIDRCIIQSTQVSTNGNSEGCKVPGIVLEYITRNSSSQNFVRVWDGSPTDEKLKDVRRLSFHPNRNSKWTLPKVSDPKVRTLAVFSKEEEEAITTLSNKEAIAEYSLLRVLDMEGCGGLDNSDFKNISCNLLLLKYLSLGGSITKVPREIEKLQLLETLDLRKTNIDLVPVEVIKLPQLKHLLGKFQLVESGIFRKRDFLKENKMVRKELERFLSSDDCKLEILSGFVTNKGQGFPQLLSHMTNLKKVKVWCESTTHIKNINDLSEGIQKFLYSGANARSLSIDFTGCGKELSSQLLGSLVDPATAGNLTTPTLSLSKNAPPTSTRIGSFRSLFRSKKLYNSSGQKSHTTLYSLKLYGELNCFPVFVTELSSITELCLYYTNLSPEVMQDGLTRLKNSILKYLKLVENDVGPLKIQTKYFTGLERICLVGKNAVNMITIQDKALPLLVSLHILCKGLDGLAGIQIHSLPSLKEVGLHSGGTDVTKGTWQAAAMSHPNWPNLILINQEEPQDLCMPST